MMVKAKYRRFLSYVLVFFLGIPSCTSVAKKDTQHPLSHLNVSETEWGIESSDSSVKDGGLFYVVLTAPAHLGNEPVEISSTFLGKSFLFYEVSEPRRFIGLFVAEYMQKPGTYPVQISIKSAQGVEKKSLQVKVESGKYGSEKLSVAPRKVSPNKKDLIRIRKEVNQVKNIYLKKDPQKKWDSGFLIPLDSVLTSVYGTKRVFNGKMQSFHNGADFRAAIGTPILAPARGEVVLAQDLFFTGNTVILDHGLGLFTIYAHMSELKVKVGDTVSEKDLLGLSGKTGRVSGPHLHWGAVLNGMKFDPMELKKVL